MLQPILEIPTAFKLGVSGRPPFLRVPHKGFVLEHPGIYALEGPNSSGKSMLVRLLTGSLPTVFDRVDVPILLDGKLIKLDACEDALAAGIVAVYQDDILISSMTVYEHLILRHSQTKVTDFGSYLWDLAYHHLLLSFKTFGAAIPDWLQKILDKLEPKRIDWRNRRAIREEAIAFFSRHKINQDILDDFPTILSGGRKAAAKLACAQLYKNIRVLILDEALTGVERNIWPGYVDRIKQWAVEKQIAVLIVSHMQEELTRWEPIKRFVIRDEELHEDDQAPVGLGRGSALTRRENVRVFDIGTISQDIRATIYSNIWKSFGNVEEVLVIIDQEIISSDLWTEFRRSTPAGLIPVELQFSTDHTREGVQYYWELLERIDTSSRDKRCVLIVVGGEAAMNWGGFIGATVAHRNIRTLLVPGTAEAMTFAATSMMASISLPERARLNVEPMTATASIFIHPASTLLNIEFIKKQPPTEIKCALVGCLRMGLLTDDVIFKKSIEQLCSATIDHEKTFEIIKDCVRVAGEIVSIDADLTGISRILRYGETHARALEIMSNGKLGRGESLLLGMVSEALLCGSNTTVRDNLIRVLKGMASAAPHFLAEVEDENVFAAYSKTCAGTSILGLELSEVGQFNVKRMRDRLSVSGDIRNFSDGLVKSAERRVHFSGIVAVYSILRAALK